jgi:5-methyltetrahydropteroyltriglutamate--homocysteine methyltransferase
MTVYRAEVVGSLLRPQYLLEARAAFEGGELQAHEFKWYEDRAVDQAIALQEGAGVDVVTDGEMRRFTFFDQLITAVDGLSEIPAKPVPFHADDGSEINFESPVSVTGKLKRKQMLTPPEYAYARARARRPVKVTLPSPLMVYCMYTPEHSSAAYADPFELFEDAAALIREEVRVLAAEGCRYVQIDAPDLGDLVDEGMRRHWASLGIAPERALTDGVDLINSVADGIEGVQFSMHVCRGNYQSRWIGEGGYESIAAAIFERCTNFDRFLLEYDTPRTGSFDPLVDLPDDKVAALGLVSTKHDAIESIDALIDRIEAAARFHPKDMLAICTQCGFASVAMGNEISERAQEQKLRLVAETARRVWGDD